MTEGIQLPYNNAIKALEPEVAYTYLGIEEGDRTEHHKTKFRIQKEYKRINLALKSELSERTR